MIQANNAATILECVKQFGPAPGAKLMVTWEFQHASEAIESGIYISFRSFKNNQDCSRIGSQSKCFCGHLFKNHLKSITKKAIKTGCQQCNCKSFSFIPRRPEELGQWWLPRRKGFNINTWRPQCTCKHTHEEHDPNTKKCNKCGCYTFQSDFCCINCDGRYEEHETLYQFEQERRMEGRSTKNEYYPFADNPELQQEVKKKINFKSYEEQMIEELQGVSLQEEEKIQGPKLININKGGPNIPEVNIIIQGQNFQPKQNLQKPEKAIRLMNAQKAALQEQDFQYMQNQQEQQNQSQSKQQKTQVSGLVKRPVRGKKK